MKKFLTILFSITLSVSSYAQDFDKYIWNTHNVTMEAPEDLEITLSNKDYFELENEYYTIQMDYYVSNIDLIEMAMESNLNINTNVTDSWSGNDYIGTSIQGKVKDSKNNIIAAKISDTKNKKNYYVEIIYADGGYPTARKILRSITTR